MWSYCVFDVRWVEYFGYYILYNLALVYYAYFMWLNVSVTRYMMCAFFISITVFDEADGVVGYAHVGHGAHKMVCWVSVQLVTHCLLWSYLFSASNK